ncbi:hypothetical protein ACX80E_10290 [Arthrobacter sp. TMN-49]
MSARGADKSWLARLVMGIAEHTSGIVHTVGTRARYGTAAGAHQGRVGEAMVSQDVHVFSGMLAQDLRLAASVGAGGTPLTADKSQQLAMAELLLADPLVAVLDEVTAEAGNRGATDLAAAAQAAMRGRTSLVIAHNLSQAVAADKVVVIEQGRIVEQGSREDLLSRRGSYATLWEHWDAGGAGVSAE